MSDAPSEPLPDLDDAAYRRALAILVDVGSALALELKVPSEAASAPNVAVRAEAFEKVARAVRRTILLSQHLAENTPAQAAERAQRETKRALVRKQVIRAVEDSIHREARPAAVETLRAELLERIDAPEFDDDVTSRTPDQVIAELCRDLGLATLPGMRPALRRTPGDIAILCAQAAAAAGSGLPQWSAAAANAVPPGDPAPDRDHTERDATTLCDFLLKER